MKSLPVIFDPDALADLEMAWRLVNANDGEERADRVVRKLEAFCFRLGDMPNIGTARSERFPGLRTVGVLGMRTGTVVFRVEDDRLTIVRVGYLGQNVLGELLGLVDSE